MLQMNRFRAIGMVALGIDLIFVSALVLNPLGVPQIAVMGIFVGGYIAFVCGCCMLAQAQGYGFAAGLWGFFGPLPFLILLLIRDRNRGQPRGFPVLIVPSRDLTGPTTNADRTNANSDFV
jgi:hypothetical protein